MLILLSTWTNLSGQTVRFDRGNFPAEKFKVTYDTTEMTGFKIVLIVARPILELVAQYQGTKVWIQRQAKGRVTEKYLGEIETESGFYRPYSQPIKDTFIIVASGEYEGQITLITRDGDFTTIPGYYYALNKTGYIYTQQSYGDTIIYKYDLKKRKGMDLKSKNVTVDSLLFNEVEYWVK